MTEFDLAQALHMRDIFTGTMVFAAEKMV